MYLSKKQCQRNLTTNLPRHKPESNRKSSQKRQRIVFPNRSFQKMQLNWQCFSLNFFRNCSLALAIDQSHRPIRWNNHGMPFAVKHEAACRANVAATVKWRSFQKSRRHIARPGAAMDRTARKP